MPLSRDAKWLISTLLALTAVVLAVAGGVWGLSQTMATKSDITGLATTVDVEKVGARLDATAAALQATVDGLGATVDGLGATAARFQETTNAVNELIEVTLPAFFTCMVELDSARAARVRLTDGTPPPTDGRMTDSADPSAAPLSQTCGLDIAAVERRLVPPPPDEVFVSIAPPRRLRTPRTQDGNRDNTLVSAPQSSVL